MEYHQKDFLEKQIDNTIKYEAMEEINNTPQPVEQPAIKVETEPVREEPEPRKTKSPLEKKVTVLTIVVLLLSVAVMLLCIKNIFGNKSNKNVPSSSQPVAVAEGGLKIAYIDTDTLMAKYDYANDIKKDLEAYSKSKEQSYKSQITQFQNDYQKYLKEGADMTLTQQKAKETELQNRAQQMQGLEGQMAMQIQEKTMKESEKMTRAVYAFIREYNATHQQFDLILSKSFSSSPVLYGNESLDITNEIVEGLNAEYKELKKDNNKK